MTHAQEPVAVVDIGSNTAKMVVVRVTRAGHLEVLADAQAPLRLVREVGAKRNLSAEAIARTLEVLGDFRAVAQAAGAGPIIAVATSAVREAANGYDLVGRARRALRSGVQAIDGQREARCAFLGAVHGLPVENGLVLDLGGGSLQIARFRSRRLRRAVTLPLGALRLSDRFLAHDRPTGKEMGRLKETVRASLQKAGICRLRPDERLVGTGGTIRNLAKMDRHRRDYPIPRLHGYVLGRRRLEDLGAFLASRRRAKRAAIPGLNADRVDSIVGGVLVVQAVMKAVRADELLVSGQGLREGLVLGEYLHALRPAKVVRQASILALASRFTTWNARTAAHRAWIAARLLAVLMPKASAEVQEMLSYAAMILDVGQSVDYFKRHDHAAMVLKATDLAGFSHRAIALLSAIMLQAGDGATTWKSYRPLLHRDDQEPVAQAATILTLADEVVRRWVGRHAVPIRCEVHGKQVALAAPGIGPWTPRRLADRFERAFGLGLVLGDASPGEKGPIGPGSHPRLRWATPDQRAEQPSSMARRRRLRRLPASRQ